MNIITVQDLTSAMERQPGYDDFFKKSSHVGQLLLYPEFHRLRVRNSIEVGTHLGHTTAFMALACRENGGKVYSIDIDPEIHDKARALLAAVEMSDSAELVTGSSTAVLPDLVRRVPFTAAYIDARHSYEDSRFEFETLYEAMDKNAPHIIVFDDAVHVHPREGGDGGVPRLMDELIALGHSVKFVTKRWAVLTD